MKKSGQFSIKIPSWMDEIISKMAQEQEVSKNAIVNELLRAKLFDLGYSNAGLLIDKIRKETPLSNDEQELLG